MIHIVDYDTHTGYSSVADSAGNNEVSYATFWSTFASQADLVRSGADEGEITLTGTFTNPITHKQAVGFLENVDNRRGRRRQGLSVDLGAGCQNNCRRGGTSRASTVTPSFRLIMADGKYVMKTATLKNENFWEFVRTYNNLGYDETDALMNRFYERRDGHRNSEGQQRAVHLYRVGAVQRHEQRDILCRDSAGGQSGHGHDGLRGWSSSSGAGCCRSFFSMRCTCSK